MYISKIDKSDFKKRLIKINKQMKKAGSFTEVKQLIFAYDDIISTINDYQTRITILHNLDLSNCKYTKLVSEMSFIMISLIKPIENFSKQIVKSKFKDDIIKEFGSVYFNLFSDEENGNKGLFLFIKEMKAIRNYQNAINLIRVNEKSIIDLRSLNTSSNINTRKKSYDDLALGLENAKLDNYYNSLVYLRNKMAIKQGYNNYREYSYYLKNRAFDKEMVLQFQKNVRKIIVPFLHKLKLNDIKRCGYNKISYYNNNLLFSGKKPSLLKNKLTDYLDTFLSIDPEFGFLFKEMMDNDYIKINRNPNKLNACYSTFLFKDKMPYMHGIKTNTTDDLRIISHEFGHCYAFYQAMKSINSIELINLDTDAAEIHSLCMEEMFIAHQKMFDCNSNDLYLYEKYQGALYLICYSTMLDHFQNIIYENPNDEDRSKVYRRLEKIYLPWIDYEDNDFYNSGKSYWGIDHLFSMPFYSIDYALAQVIAFGYREIYMNNPNAAINKYKFVTSKGKNFNFFDNAFSLGIANPFEKTNFILHLKPIFDLLLNIQSKL